MSDDTFIREVNEQMRQERLNTAWRRFGKFIVGGLVVAVLATIGYVVWERQVAAQAAADGDRYYAAVDLAEQGDTAGALAGFESLVADGVGAYPDLARLRIASTLAASGDEAGAVARLDEVAASSAPQPLRDLAAVRAAYILVDTGTPAEVRERVERLTNESSPMRHSAREALGLSLWWAGDGAAARPFFQQITDDLSAPSGIAQRARLMIGLIDAGTAPVAAPAAAEPAAAPATAPLEPGADVPPAPGGAPVPVDPAPAPAAADPTLTTPLAEQLNLPEAATQAPAPAQETGETPSPANQAPGAPANATPSTPGEAAPAPPPS